MSCQGEAPHVAQFARANPEIQVIAIAAPGADAGLVDAFRQKYYATAPVQVFTDDGETWQEFGIEDYPAAVFFDEQGTPTEPFDGFPVES